ncbi:MAG: hypothetical protein D6732_13605 [Methanobacteriota archaeon]|nr:MAG: hypothetical protein D6732_13605 [Euryarchaeota archaeon]
MVLNSHSLRSQTEQRLKRIKKSIRVCPTIYQEYIEKQYELRITVIGDRVLAVKILSNNDQATMIDWRAAHIYGRSPVVEKFSLPAEWEAMAKAWVNGMGLLFGAIDAIVNKDEQIVFLEVNPFGQFLWCEQLVPDVHILDAFCRVVEERCGILRSCDSRTISMQDLENAVMKEFSEVKGRDWS